MYVGKCAPSVLSRTAASLQPPPPPAALLAFIHRGRLTDEALHKLNDILRTYRQSNIHTCPTCHLVSQVTVGFVHTSPFNGAQYLYISWPSPYCCFLHNTGLHYGCHIDCSEGGRRRVGDWATSMGGGGKEKKGKGDGREDRGQDEVQKKNMGETEDRKWEETHSWR